MSLIRAFIAVELPTELKRELSDLVADLRKKSPPIVKWVNPEGIHITFKFLGDISEDSITEILPVIEESVKEISPFKLGIAEIGAFPDLNNVQVVWVGVRDGIDKAQQIQENLEIYCEPLGFPLEKRKFTPHLTLGRVHRYTSPGDRERLGKLLARTSFKTAHDIEVKEVCLMKSRLTSSGSIYTCLRAISLK